METESNSLSICTLSMSLHLTVIVLPLFFATGSACHFGSSCPLLPFPYLPPSTLPSSPFSTLPIGPASHCGWSRLSSIPPTFLALTSTLSHYLGPACHCGRSRLDCSLLPLLPYRSLVPTSSIVTSRSIPSPLPSYWPGLSLR